MATAVYHNAGSHAGMAQRETIKDLPGEAGTRGEGELGEAQSTSSDNGSCMFVY